MYKLFKDKSTNFECNVAIEGAPLNKAKARLVLQNDEFNIVFEGKIDSTGKCIVPIKKLSILPEGLTGKLKLEVIVENDTYFSPYEDDFEIGLNKKVTVEVKQSVESAKKVTVEVKKSPLAQTKTNDLPKKSPISEILNSKNFKNKVRTLVLNESTTKSFNNDPRSSMKKIILAELKKRIK